MKKILSTSQVARALQVSESSVKRWCDQGAIDATYTAGGHRRIAVEALVNLLRSSRLQLVEPEIVGLPKGTRRVVGQLSEITLQFQTVLAAGNETECRRIVYGLFLAETSVASICDEVISPAINNIGMEWECDNLEIYQERRGCELVGRIIYELGTLIPVPPTGAHVAIGGGIERDPYSLASRMVALVLRDCRWKATTLGPGLPWETLGAAIAYERPRLFWLSVSAIGDIPRFEEQYNRLFDEYGSQVAFVLGGRAITANLRHRIKYASFCDTLQHLELFANALVNQTQ